MRHKNSARRHCLAIVVGVAICGTMLAPATARAVCVLTCPANVTLITQSPVGIAFTYAVEQAGCTGTVEQTQGLPSGFFFPPGQTMNSFRDTVATSSTCSFTVTVKRVPPNGAPAAGPLGLAALAIGLAGLGAWAAGRRRA